MHTKPVDLACAILAARHAAFAEGVRSLLKADFQDVAVVADLPSLQESLRQLHPNLVVVDLPLAGSTGPEVLRSIHSVSPGTRVIVMTIFDQATVARMALQAGAQGVVLKRTAGTDLQAAVETVVHGGVYVSPGFGAAPETHRKALG